MKQTKSAGARQALLRRGAANRGRTGTESLPKDFKSFVSAYSTIAANLFFSRLPDALPGNWRDIVEVHKKHNQYSVLRKPDFYKGFQAEGIVGRTGF